MRIACGGHSQTSQTMNIPRVPSKRKPDDRQFHVGDGILVNLHRGQIEEATITAIIHSASGKKLQVDFGKDMTALIDTWQVVEQ